MKISELMIHLQEVLKDYGDLEVRASIYDSDWETSIESEITNSEIETYISTSREDTSCNVLILNNDNV